jgi:hypothetical protein
VTSELSKTNGDVESIILNNEIGLLIQPNPFNESLTIQINESDYMGNTQLRLMDLNGKKLRWVDLPAGDLSYRFETTELPSGMYLLIVEQGNNRTTVKVLK